MITSCCTALLQYRYDNGSRALIYDLLSEKNENENGPILQKPWQGATPPPHGGVAEPGDGQDDRERGECERGE